MILLVLFMAATTWSSPVGKRGQGHKCQEERLVRTMNNVTGMVNVTVTVHELCLNLSEGFLCTRQLTHTVPRLTVETVTRCCPGYISDHNNECVLIREERGSGAAVQDSELAHKTQTSDWTPISVIVISLILLTLMIIGTKKLQQLKRIMKKNWRSYADKIQAAWSQWSHSPSKAEIETATWMACGGYLTSVEHMKISDMSITDIPRDQMEKLASIVTGIVYIGNMKHTDQLVSILASVKCPTLCLEKMELSFEETRALVTAMWDRVERVGLGDVTLVIEELTHYNGQGRCRELRMVGRDMNTRYGDRLRKWAADKGWTVTACKEGGLVMVK